MDLFFTLEELLAGTPLVQSGGHFLLVDIQEVIVVTRRPLPHRAQKEADSVAGEERRRVECDDRCAEAGCLRQAGPGAIFSDPPAPIHANRSKLESGAAASCSSSQGRRYRHRFEFGPRTVPSK